MANTTDSDADLLAESADDAEPSKPAFLKHNVVVWINDEDCLACADCKLLFSFFRRKHHCRACGKVFCAKCTKNAIPLPDFDLHKPERVRARERPACFTYSILTRESGVRVVLPGVWAHGRADSPQPADIPAVERRAGGRGGVRARLRARIRAFLRVAVVESMFRRRRRTPLSISSS